MKPKTKVVIFLEGGLVHSVVTDTPGVEVAVMDFDIEGSRDWERLTLKRPDGSGRFESCPHFEKARYCPGWTPKLIEAVKKFIKKMRSEKVKEGAE